MSKYLTIFKISLEQEFVYRLNFIMWRVRNIIQICLLFFLWDTVFADPKQVFFGYDRSKILTYVFCLLVIKSLVTGARSVDIAGEVADGRFTNYLLKPVSYFRFWFTRDLSSKALNMIFIVFEFTLLFFLLKPPFFFQTNLFYLGFFLFSLSLAILLFFLLLLLVNLFPLWYPDQAWGPTFLLMIFVDFLGGGVFPLDVLSPQMQKLISFSPFPYLLFQPLQIYLGKLTTVEVFRSTVITLVWTGILLFSVRKLWSIGVRAYRSEGR